MENNRVIDHLQTLNAVFAQANPMHPERAEHAHKVLDFMLAEEPAQADALSLINCAERLFLLHFEAEQNNHMAFAHLHVPAVEILSPLWLRSALLAELRKLSGRKRALLFVSGLRASIAAQGSYWTQQRQAQFERTRAWVEDEALARAAAGAELQLLII